MILVLGMGMDRKRYGPSYMTRESLDREELIVGYQTVCV